MISKVLITKLILYYSAIQGFDGNLALSVSKIESGLNPTAIGKTHHEIGLFQIRSEYSKFSKKELMDPIINIKEGLRILADAKKNCIHKKAHEFLVCYNVGKTGAKKIKHPEQFDYIKKINIAMAKL